MFDQTRKVVSRLYKNYFSTCHTTQVVSKLSNSSLKKIITTIDFENYYSSFVKNK